MKRLELIKHLRKQGCVLYREGKRHTLYLNPDNGHISPVPRHIEISDFLVIRICSVELNIPLPKKKS